jgi:hypothetical protein
LPIFDQLSDPLTEATAICHSSRQACHTRIPGINSPVWLGQYFDETEMLQANLPPAGMKKSTRLQTVGGQAGSTISGIAGGEAADCSYSTHVL